MFKVERRPNGDFTYYGATGDFNLAESGRNAIDVYKVTLAPPPGTAAGGGRSVCKRSRATIVGTQGDDRLRGASGRDVIMGRGGGDVIKGRGGKDQICSGGGNDTVRSGGGRTTSGSSRAAQSSSPASGQDAGAAFRSLFERNSPRDSQPWASASSSAALTSSSARSFCSRRTVLTDQRSNERSASIASRWSGRRPACLTLY